MKNIYPQVDNNPNFPAVEEKILKNWKEKSIFQESLEIRKDNQPYVFFDGPPFANGSPHYGHLLTGYIKDLVARYQTMKGKFVERRFGWDCHGLPAEMGAEKELKISGRNQIINFGVDKFNEHCRSSVMKFTHIWEEYVDRQARWVDFKNDYKTMDVGYMESVLWAFKQLYEKGLIYESFRVMPYSWACETPLSNFETRLDNSYRERTDKAITVTFKLKETPKNWPSLDEYKILAWTTTPWTLPSNLALAVGPELKYCLVQKDNTGYIIAESSLKNYSKEIGEEIVTTFAGKDLVNLKYEPLFPYFNDHENSFKILEGDFVTEGDGTGVVHLAPGFGEDDQRVCADHNIKIVCPVDDSGKFTKEVPDYLGKNVFDTIDEIIIRLKKENKWLRTEQYIHNYPHCWRTDTPLIYKAVSSWYVEVTKFKDRMVELNQQINWIPDHIKNGLFGKWLENARDWSISRNRFWGTPIPVWKSSDPTYPHIDVYGSIEEIERDFGVKVTDLHKHHIDHLTRPNPSDPTGKSVMKRVTEVFDCWFESGSMSFAQSHYPFENKEKFEQNFPADFIVEYVAQTRGWFYTLMVLSTALFDKPPFLNCICHGVILDQSGRKLSKSLNNYADPLDIFNNYGSDALRFLMLSSPIMRGSELYIDKEGSAVKDVIRLSIKPFWNAYNFFTLYANSDQIKAQYDLSSNNLLDQYILSKLKMTVEKIDKSLGTYDVSASYEAFTSFIEVLNNWYIRRNRNRFWKNEKDQDKLDAYNTLYSVLIILSKACASMIPLITEEIYQGLMLDNSSVHLQEFPDLSNFIYNEKLVNDMDKVRDICSSSLSIRNQENIRIRQPLNMLSIYGKGLERLKDFSDLIKDEVNVKNIEFAQALEGAADFKLKINFSILGKRLPEKIKEIIADSKNNKWQKNDAGNIVISDEILTDSECEIMLIPKQAKGSCALSGNDGMLVLDLNITDELKSEGLARDVIRAIQQARKDMDLNIADNVNLILEVKSDWVQELTPFISYIQEQTLSSIEFARIDINTVKKTIEAQILEEHIKIGFKK